MMSAGTSNQLESLSAGAMVVNLNLESLGPMVLVTMRPRPSRQVRQTRIEDHVSGHLLHSTSRWYSVVRFLLERGLRFRNLGFCEHNLI